MFNLSHNPSTFRTELISVVFVARLKSALLWTFIDLKHDHSVHLASFYHSPDPASYWELLLATIGKQLEPGEWVRSKTGIRVVFYKFTLHSCVNHLKYHDCEI